MFLLDNLDLIMVFLIFTLYCYNPKLLNLNLMMIFMFIVFVMSFNVEYLNLMEFKLFFVVLLCVFFISVLSMDKSNSTDQSFLMYLVLLGSLIMMISKNLILVYMGLELQTFSLFVLISASSESMVSSEGGLKYFILGALSSGVFLLSLSIIYGLINNLNVDFMNFLDNMDYGYFWKMMLLLSMFFKLSMFPLHFWMPDIYESSNSLVIGLMGVLPKISVLGFVIQANLFSNMLIWCSLGSMMMGTMGALNQSKIKSLMAYSGISHIGLGMLSYSLFVKTGMQPSLVYMLVYALTFVPMVILISFGFENKTFFIYDLNGLSNMNILLSISWAILLLSIGGIPPLSGFLMKWWVMLNLIMNNNMFTSLIVILFSMMGVAYYMSITKMNYFQKGSSYYIWNDVLSNSNNLGLTSYIYLGMGVYIACLLIMNPKPVLMMVDYLILSFF